MSMQSHIGPDGMTRSMSQEQQINKAVARIFGSPEGEMVLRYLKSITIERVCGPDYTPSTLPHMEGQRFIVGVLDKRRQLGEEGKPHAHSDPEKPQV